LKKAYIILAHKNEQQVQRLIDSLDDGNATFFLHVDLKVAIDGFEDRFTKDNRVRFVKRVKAEWGSFGLVEATLNALYSIRNSDYFDKVILLSGQDYPIKSNEEIDHFFHESPYNIFMDHFPLPNHRKWGPGGGMYRVNKYFFGLSIIHKALAKVANFIALVIPSLKRKLLIGIVPFSGSQWWAMDMRALDYVLNYVSEHPEYVKFHKHTFAPDELFFQMILLNCEDKTMRENIANDDLRYTKWKTSKTAHPEVLKVDDLNHIEQSEALFARKFDSCIDDEIIDIIDTDFLKRVNAVI
jgi:hypothetical protein